MEDYPKTLLELEKLFNTEEACREYLFRLRWPNGFQCPRCKRDKAWLRNNGLYECAYCGLKTSIVAGTIFQDTKKSLCLWFRAIWHVTSQKYGANALGLQRLLGLGSYRTAWTWLHKLRRAMVRPDRDKLSGIVQVDEAYIGGKKSGKRGRGAAGKALVEIMTQIKGAHIGRIRLQRVPNASAESLEEAIQGAIEPGSIIWTDGWKGYNQLKSLGYTHEIIRPETEVGDNLLPQCNRVASLLQRWLLGTHQGAVSHDHLDYYLDEYTFRFNRRTSQHRGKLFYRLIQQAVTVQPTPLKSMIKHVRGQKPQHNI